MWHSSQKSKCSKIKVSKHIKFCIDINFSLSQRDVRPDAGSQANSNPRIVGNGKQVRQGYTTLSVLMTLLPMSKAKL